MASQGIVQGGVEKWVVRFQVIRPLKNGANGAD